MTSPGTSNAGDLPLLSDVAMWQGRSAVNLATFIERIARAMDRRWMHWDDAWAADLQGLTPFFNSATVLHPLAMVGAIDREMLGRLSRYYDERPGAPWMLWSAWPSSLSEMEEEGFALVTRLPLMVRPPGGSLPAASPMTSTIF